MKKLQNEISKHPHVGFTESQESPQVLGSFRDYISTVVLLKGVIGVK